MTGVYLVELVDVLVEAGLDVSIAMVNAGWETRSNSTGGFVCTPLGVQWHHTASSTTPENDLDYMINRSGDRPMGNLYLDRTGTWWPIAAGAANTAGKGGPLTLSRGTIPVNGANSRTVAIEAANNGVGEPWPAVQVDAYFAGTLAVNDWLGNSPADVFTHAIGAGDGWTSRKIDPATAAAVQGSWCPRGVNTSGTWSLADIRTELVRRAATPIPPPPEEDDMPKHLLAQKSDGSLVVMSADLTSRFALYGEDYGALVATGQYVEVRGMRDDTIDRVPYVGED